MPDRVKVGDVVVLGEHEDLNGDKLWDSDMFQYVGKVATIKKEWFHNPFGPHNLYYYYVDIDKGDFIWRAVSMTLVSHSKGQAVSSSTVVSYGSKCSKCHEYNAYVPASDNFICYGCRN